MSKIISTLEKIHRSAARFVVHDHRRTTSVTHIQSKLGWQTLETRRLQHQLVFMYKIKYNLRTEYLSATTSHCPCTQTRNSDPNKFVQIPTRINTYAYSFYPRVIRAWNFTEWNNKTPIHRYLPSGREHFQTCSTSPSQSFVNTN